MIACCLRSVHFPFNKIHVRANRSNNNHMILIGIAIVERTQESSNKKIQYNTQNKKLSGEKKPAIVQ